MEMSNSGKILCAVVAIFILVAAIKLFATGHREVVCNRECLTVEKILDSRGVFPANKTDYRLKRVYPTFIVTDYPLEKYREDDYLLSSPPAYFLFCGIPCR
jgi:hypothetical protein